MKLGEVTSRSRGPVCQAVTPPVSQSSPARLGEDGEVGPSSRLAHSDLADADSILLQTACPHFDSENTLVLCTKNLPLFLKEYLLNFMKKDIYDPMQKLHPKVPPVGESWAFL